MRIVHLKFGSTGKPCCNRHRLQTFLQRWPILTSKREDVTCKRCRKTFFMRYDKD